MKASGFGVKGGVCAMPLRQREDISVSQDTRERCNRAVALGLGPGM